MTGTFGEDDASVGQERKRPRHFKLIRKDLDGKLLSSVSITFLIEACDGLLRHHFSEILNGPDEVSERVDLLLGQRAESRRYPFVGIPFAMTCA